MRGAGLSCQSFEFQYQKLFSMFEKLSVFLLIVHFKNNMKILFVLVFRNKKTFIGPQIRVIYSVLFLLLQTSIVTSEFHKKYFP
jgi:hypothetical protein